MKKSKLPFENLIAAMVGMGIPEPEAILRVQSRLDNFVNEKQQLIQRSDIEANETARLSNTSQITLATVLVPLIGFVFSQQAILDGLSDLQKITILIVIFMLFMSIIFGILAHRFGSKFFSKWADGSAQALKNVNDTVDGIDSTLELYDNFDRKMIELKLIDEDRVGTKKSSSVWDNLQFISVVFSGILIVILFYSILFDVPFWRN